MLTEIKILQKTDKMFIIFNNTFKENERIILERENHRKKIGANTF